MLSRIESNQIKRTIPICAHNLTLNNFKLKIRSYLYVVLECTRRTHTVCLLYEEKKKPFLGVGGTGGNNEKRTVLASIAAKSWSRVFYSLETVLRQLFEHKYVKIKKIQRLLDRDLWKTTNTLKVGTSDYGERDFSKVASWLERCLTCDSQMPLSRLLSVSLSRPSTAKPAPRAIRNKNQKFDKNITKRYGQ